MSDCADNAVFFDVYLGSHNVRLTAEPTRVEVRATEYIVHENWGPVRIVNDVALIKLPSPVTFTRKILNEQHLQQWWEYLIIEKSFFNTAAEIQPICLAPSTESDHAGDMLHISGWGKPSDGKSKQTLHFNFFVYIFF